MNKLPKIGMRNIKTAIAVFICLFINVILLMIDKDFAEAAYTPFFAGIAACYSMQNNTKQSWKNAKIRGIGSIAGGLFGMCVVLVFEAICKTNFFGDQPVFLIKLYLYIFVSLSTVLMIYLSVCFHFTNATFITCLTYLSVTVSLRNNGMQPIPFAFNRIGSTVIGLAISLMVNAIYVPKRKHKNVMIVSGLDGTLLNSNKGLSGFTKYKLNYLISHGAKLTIATTRTPASLRMIFNGVNIHTPMIVMNGAALYSLKKQNFECIKTINEASKEEIASYFKENKVNAFSHSIIDDVLHIYHGDLVNDGEKKYYYDRRNDYFKNYIHGEPNPSTSMCYYIVVDTKERIMDLASGLSKLPHIGNVTVTTYPFAELEGYYNLKINSIEASKQRAIEELKLAQTVDYVVAFGGREFDIPMIEHADYSFALSGADDCVKARVDEVVKRNNPDDLVKLMTKIYHSSMIRKKIKLKEGSK